MNVFKITAPKRKRGGQQGQLKFRFLSGDCNWRTYGGKLVSKRLNNGEFDYWLVIDVVNREDAHGRDALTRYYVSLQSVSPDEAGEQNLREAMRACGCNPEPIEDLTKVSNWEKVGVLSSYGIYATLWSDEGNNLSQLLKEARLQADASQLLYGFMMDGAQNQIGNSGWDTQRGDIGFCRSRVAEEEAANA